MNKGINQSEDIVYSCYFDKSRAGEHFVPQHSFAYQISGSLILNNGSRDFLSNEGDFRFVRRSQLMKFAKYPPPDGEFRSLSVYLTQAALKSFSLEYQLKPDYKVPEKSVWDITAGPLLKTYVQSLLDYHQNPSLQTTQLTQLKIKEAILLLLQSTPDLKNVLFDFSDPHKIDLEEFMNNNYHFNVHLERFAYLTGRSLASFKRDFEKQFNATPGRWLQQKRLQEAWHLIAEKGKSASEIYIDLGFEDLSHFSYAFKKQFGKAPTKIGGLQSSAGQ